jgi:hypothetical protein
MHLPLGLRLRPIIGEVHSHFIGLGDGVLARLAGVVSGYWKSAAIPISYLEIFERDHPVRRSTLKLRFSNTCGMRGRIVVVFGDGAVMGALFRPVCVPRSGDCIVNSVDRDVDDSGVRHGGSLA